jgi:hypothetical protein
MSSFSSNVSISSACSIDGVYLMGYDTRLIAEVLGDKLFSELISESIRDAEDYISSIWQVIENEEEIPRSLLNLHRDLSSILLHPFKSKISCRPRRPSSSPSPCFIYSCINEGCLHTGNLWFCMDHIDVYNLEKNRKSGPPAPFRSRLPVCCLVHDKSGFDHSTAALGDLRRVFVGVFTKFDDLLSHLLIYSASKLYKKKFNGWDRSKPDWLCT